MSGNLLIVFRRDRKRDFASGDGPELLASKIEQVLATEGATHRSSGEMPWRTSLGTSLVLLRHHRNDAVLAELARVYVRDALRKWLPEVELVQVSAVRDGATVTLTIRYRAKAEQGEIRGLSMKVG